MATGLLIGGTALSIFGQLSEAKLQAEALKTGAAIDDANAVLAEQAGEREAGRARRVGRAQQAGRLARIGATGITASSFDPILDEAARENELDALAIQMQAGAEARGLRLSARAKRSQARSTKLSGTIGAFATGLEGAGTVLKDVKPQKPTPVKKKGGG